MYRMKQNIAKIIVMCMLFSLMFGHTAARAQDPVDNPVGQLKILARYNDSMSFYDGHAYLLFTSYKDNVTITVDDLYCGYHISDDYYTDIRSDISNGSNHMGKDTESYFTEDKGMNSVTLNRGEIVTIGMYRGFDLSVPDTLMGAIQNSTLFTTGSDEVKSAVLETMLGLMSGGESDLQSVMLGLLGKIQGMGININQLVDGTVEGGVCFNRELYNQKLEWDQFENVTYEMDITQDQLDILQQALKGNLNKFSIFKNSCATVALRAWNAVVGTDSALRLEPSGTGIFAFIDAPKTVRDEIKQKLPGYYLNKIDSTEEEREPGAGYIEDGNWIYVSAPESLDDIPVNSIEKTKGETGKTEDPGNDPLSNEEKSYVGRLTIHSRPIQKGDPIPHGCITFTTYEELEVPISYYIYYKPSVNYEELMTEYKFHPEEFTTDPAKKNDDIVIEDREAYFETITNGPESEPDVISLKAGEGITVSNYSFAENDNETILGAINNSTLMTNNPETQDLVGQYMYFVENGRIEDVIKTLKALFSTIKYMFGYIAQTGQNPVDGHVSGGQVVNREMYNMFCYGHSQLHNNYYTVEITGEERDALLKYLADPKNNYYSPFTKNCATGAVDAWNAALADRPELTLSLNLTGLSVEPQSLNTELGRLILKTGKAFAGTGEGGGTDYDPRIRPGYDAEEPVSLNGVSIRYDSMLVGAEITAEYDPLDIPNLSYQWYQTEVTTYGESVEYCYTEIPDAQGISYTLRPEDVGKYITIKLIKSGREIGNATISEPVVYGTVVFDSLGGSQVNSDGLYNYNSKITEPKDPERVGCRFLGWYSSFENGVYSNKWSFGTDTVKEKKTTLYAKWESIPVYPPVTSIPVVTVTPTAIPTSVVIVTPTAEPTSVVTVTPTATPEVTKAPEPTGKPAIIEIDDSITSAEAKKATVDLNMGLKVRPKNDKIVVKWGKVEGAERYDIYASYCKKGSKFLKVASLDGDVKSYRITKLNDDFIKTDKNVKLYVVAYRKVNGEYKKLAKSIVVHIAGEKSKKYSNVKKIMLNCTSCEIEIGDSFKLAPVSILKDSGKKMLKHTSEFRYASSDTSIAKVDEQGKITGISAGSCIVYVYAQNGYSEKVKVNVSGFSE